MSNVLRDLAPSLDASSVQAGSPALTGRYLGPGKVVALRAHRIDLVLRDGRRVAAESALAFPYQPALEDELLVVGEGDAHWIIGVVRGTGATRLVLDGDVELRARGGSLKLGADERVAIDAPEVDVRADRLAIVAEAAQSIYGTLRKTVRELFTMRAKEHHTLVEGTVLLHSKSSRFVGEEKVTVNGKEIFLG